MHSATRQSITKHADHQNATLVTKDAIKSCRLPDVKTSWMGLSHVEHVICIVSSEKLLEIMKPII